MSLFSQFELSHFSGILTMKVNGQWVVARSHSAILHIYVPYPFVAIPVGFSMVKRSVDNCNFFKINQEEYTSPMHY